MIYSEESKLSLQRQEQILEEAILQNINLADLLKSYNLSYESLRYTEAPPLDDVVLQQIETLNENEIPLNKIPAISFFAGAGGLDVGFEYAGFENVISIERNEVFCNTLRFNNKSKIVIGPPDYTGDISNREELYELLKLKGVHANFPGVFHGGPPCQSFSIAANQRFSKNDGNFKRKGFYDAEKGTLIFDYIWFIKQFRPKAFLIENVAGIMDCDTDEMIKKSLMDLASIGYNLSLPKVLNAAYYGVPQNRMRWIAVGILSNSSISMPEPNERMTSCGSVFLKNLSGLQNHITREHTAQSVMRYMQLPYGGRDKLGRVDRLDPRLPSKTVIAGGTKGGGRSHLHPFIPRTLSVRECAKLQTFPDSYIFTGATARQFTQVGNAVPPMLAYRLAHQIWDSLSFDR